MKKTRESEKLIIRGGGRSENVVKFVPGVVVLTVVVFFYPGVRRYQGILSSDVDSVVHLPIHVSHLRVNILSLNRSNKYILIL